MHTRARARTHTNAIWICEKCAFFLFLLLTDRCIIFKRKEFDCSLFQNLIFIPVIESPIHIYTKESRAQICAATESNEI